MSDDWVHKNLGVSRRELLKRGAIVGGTIVWVAPVVQSLSSPAYAAGSATATLKGQDISFVALLLESGDTKYRVKFEAPFPSTAGFAPSECGRSFAVGPCTNKQLLRNDASVAARGCPPGVGATYSGATGQLTVALGTCRLVDFVTKCGVPSAPNDGGCEGPGDGIQPATAIGQTNGTVTFQPCASGTTTTTKASSTTTAPSPTTTKASPTTTAPSPTSTAPSPTSTAPSPTTTVPSTTTTKVSTTTTVAPTTTTTKTG